MVSFAGVTLGGGRGKKSNRPRQKDNQAITKKSVPPSPHKGNPKFIDLRGETGGRAVGSMGRWGSKVRENIGQAVDSFGRSGTGMKRKRRGGGGGTKKKT